MCAEEAKALGKIAQVLLRVKPYLEDLDDQSDFFPQRKIREMTQTVKYGIPTSEVLQMLPQFAEYPEVELVGVHVHLGRHSKKLAMWESLARAMTRMITTIRDGVGADWSPHIVSFGGGFPMGGGVSGFGPAPGGGPPSDAGAAMGGAAAVRAGIGSCQPHSMQ